MKNIFLAVGLVVLSALGVFAQEQAPEPEFRNGEVWHFNVKETGFIGSSSASLDGVYEAVFKGGKFRFSKVGGGETEENESAEGSQTSLLRAMFGQGTYYSGQHLKFPLFVGQKWEFDFHMTPRGAQKKSNQRAWVHVAGIEEVTTPAGTFRSFKVVRDNKSKTGGSTFTFNYSPDAKSVVKAVFEWESGAKRNIDLVKFGRGK